MIRAYMSQIEDLLEGDTPRQKYEWLVSLIKDNARAKGRIDFCKNQFQIIKDSSETDPHTKVWIESVIKQLETPI